MQLGMHGWICSAIVVQIRFSQYWAARCSNVFHLPPKACFKYYYSSSNERKSTAGKRSMDNTRNASPIDPHLLGARGTDQVPGPVWPTVWAWAHAKKTVLYSFACFVSFRVVC